jgi:phosphopantetheinyl transferase (holo-ACP synthase)
MKKCIVFMAAVACTLQLSAQGFKTRQDSVSYALGITMAETLKKSGISNYNEDLVKRAISEHLADVVIHVSLTHEGDTAAAVAILEAP